MKKSMILTATALSLMTVNVPATTAIFNQPVAVSASQNNYQYQKSSPNRKSVNDQDINDLKQNGASKLQIQSAHYGDIVEKQYLDKAYQEATDHYGLMEGYLHQGLGLSNQDIQKLQNKYLTNK